MEISNKQITKIAEEELGNVLREQAELMDSLMPTTSPRWLELDINEKMNMLWNFFVGSLTPAPEGKIGHRVDRLPVLKAFQARVNKIMSTKGEPGGLYDRMFNPKLKQGEWRALRNKHAHSDNQAAKEPSQPEKADTTDPGKALSTGRW